MNLKIPIIHIKIIQFSLIRSIPLFFIQNCKNMCSSQTLHLKGEAQNLNCAFSFKQKPNGETQEIFKLNSHLQDGSSTWLGLIRNHFINLYERPSRIFYNSSTFNGVPSAYLQLTLLFLSIDRFIYFTFLHIVEYRIEKT